MIISAVMQPTYLPWLGYFQLINDVDCFIFLDDVQLSKQSWQTRNRIKTSQGELVLSIPIEKSELGKGLINQIHVADRLNWRQKHLRTLHNAYAKAPYVDEVMTFLESQYAYNEDVISNFNISLIKNICEKIGIKKKFIISSDLGVPEGVKDYRVVEICKRINSEKYISPRGSMNYINREKEGGAFTDAGVELIYQEYNHPVYPQLHGEFVSNFAIVDLLFNVGFSSALKVITNN